MATNRSLSSHYFYPHINNKYKIVRLMNRSKEARRYGRKSGGSGVHVMTDVMRPRTLGK